MQIGLAVAGTDPQADVPLKPGDILSIHQITNWNDIGESVTIQGQVRFPGSYGFQDGQRLSSVLRRAGGLLPAAYPMGAVLVRDQVRELQQQSREELIRQIETNSAAARLSPNLGAGGSGATLELIKAQEQEVLSDLKSHPPTGRMVIHITLDIDSWANTPADIELRRGDVLTIPKRPGFVLVTGQVYNSTALTFMPDKTAAWYLSHAGGTNSTANRKQIFIIRANGSVVGRRSGGWFDGKVLSTKLNPGDVVVVPQKIIGPSLLWRNLLTTAQLAVIDCDYCLGGISLGAYVDSPHSRHCSSVLHDCRNNSCRLFQYAEHAAVQLYAGGSVILWAACKVKAMIHTSVLETLEENEQTPAAHPNWAVRARLLWEHRRMLARVTVISLIVSLAIAFVIPKRYQSTTSIMPPDQQNSGAMMLAALASRSASLGGLGSLAGSLLGGHTTTALFIDMLHSGTVSGHLVDRFNLQHVYHKRYRVDTAKHLAHYTKITENKKSGVITIEVEDESPVRARDLAQGYLDELNKLVTRTSISAAHRERVFIGQRLRTAQADLERAQLKLSEFSSRNSTIDIKEQTHAMVDAGARLQGELLVAQSGLESLRQIYGNGNVRVRETEARIASLQRELEKMTGSSAPLIPEAAGESGASSDASGKGELYPPLRQLPRLAVPYADLYRQVRVQETVYELLTQQYEMARIEEAKDVPIVSVIDPPGIPEKKSFPHRLLLTLALTFFSFAAAVALILVRDRWGKLDPGDSRKMLAADVLRVLRRRTKTIFSSRRGAA